MAGALSLVVADTENVDTSFTAIEEHWEVEFSRFFNFPSLPSTSLVLKPLRRSIISRLRGTWLSSSSTASLDLLTYHSTSETILVVSLRGKIYLDMTMMHVYASLHEGNNPAIQWGSSLPWMQNEEHLVSNLHFSWPQVSCVYQCPTRGSRVVFASYRDNMGQIQKFALRFSTSSEAEKFINVLKGRLKDLTNIGYPGGNTESEISCESEFFSSNGPQCRAEKDASYATPQATYTPQMLLLDNEASQKTCLQEPAPANNFEGVFAALPPSFTALLTSCCTEAEQEQPKLLEEVDLKTQITKCMLDSSFNDMLLEVEKFIGKMGGDLEI